MVLLWRTEPFRVRRSTALLGCLLCLAALAALSFAVPTDREDEFYPHQYVSKFARSAAVAAVDLTTGGVLEADAATADRLNLGTGAACARGPQAAAHRHGVRRVELRRHHDAGRQGSRRITASGFARPTARSARSWSRAPAARAGTPSTTCSPACRCAPTAVSPSSVTRFAAGRVKRGLPYALRKCGYSTYSLYSWFGAFVGARGFQTSTGIEHFLDAKQLRTGPADTDIFFYDHAARVIAQERGHGPVFVFVYLAANHFPWDYRYRPDLLPDWVNPGNPFEIDEYLRRQEMSAHDYAQFKERLAPRISRRAVPDRALRRSPAAVCQAVHGPDARPGRGGRAHPAARSPLFHHLLRDRRA